jgi:hypothetical protein
LAVGRAYPPLGWGLAVTSRHPADCAIDSDLTCQFVLNAWLRSAGIGVGCLDRRIVEPSGIRVPTIGDCGESGTNVISLSHKRLNYGFSNSRSNPSCKNVLDCRRDICETPSSTSCCGPVLCGTLSLLASGTIKSAAFASPPTDSVWQWGRIANNPRHESLTTAWITTPDRGLPLLIRDLLNSRSATRKVPFFQPFR